MTTVLIMVSQLLRAGLLIVAITVAVFVLVRVIPGDVVDVLAIEGGLTQTQAEALRADLGLTVSWIDQLRAWSIGAMQGNLGESLRFRVPVADLLVDAIPVTLQLAAASLALGFALAVTAALCALLWPRSIFRSVVDVLNIWSIAVPTFCVGLFSILVFSLWLGWMPVLGNMLVPVVVLGVDAAGQIVKPLHEEMKELGTAAYVRTARAKGLHPVRIVVVHVLPAAAPVLLAMTGLVAASFIGGALTMEVLFGLPGVGSLAFNAVTGRDYPLVQVVVLFLALSVVLINAATDLAQRLIDPRPER